MTHLQALRRITAHAEEHNPPYRPVDADLNAEAGRDGNLARLLQAARNLDAIDAAGELPIARPSDRPPCGCGNPDARWHNHPRSPGRREYACDACAPRAR